MSIPFPFGSLRYISGTKYEIAHDFASLSAVTFRTSGPRQILKKVTASCEVSHEVTRLFRLLFIFGVKFDRFYNANFGHLSLNEKTQSGFYSLKNVRTSPQLK